MEQRYFIAIVPPQQVADELVAVKKEFAERFNSKAALRSPAHITLHMPFVWKEEKEEQLLETLAGFSYSAAGQKIGLKNFGHFGDRVIFIDVLKNETLVDLQQKLVQHAKEKLQLFNQSDSLRGFHPHVTVAFRDLRKRFFEEAWKEFAGREYTASFPLCDFSLLKHDGKQWNVLRTFAL
ncbi:MAG: 2-5 ligase [Bacteroidetes bacterium]|jgi:2'-5' RNA ligase|nr:2-5 ligase [Bacteroidota bacterium]